MSPEERRRRRRILEGAAVVAVAVVGLVIRLLASGSAALDAIGVGIVGVAGVIAVSAVFYEIGAGEDEERARETGAPRARRGQPLEAAEDPHAEPAHRPGPGANGQAARPRRPPRRPRRPGG
jgi:hypothetical protein